MTKPKLWSLEFEECGGYDCMTAAYCIYAANNELVLVIDLANVENKEEAQQIAQSIVDVNK